MKAEVRGSLSPSFATVKIVPAQGLQLSQIVYNGAMYTQRFRRRAWTSVWVAAILQISLVCAAGAKFWGFESERLGEGKYRVSYAPATVMAKTANLIHLLVGNTGQLCLDRGFGFARLESILIGERPIRSVLEVSTTVEMFKDERPDTVSCAELARRPKTPKELKRQGTGGPLLPYHSLVLEESRDAFEGTQQLKSQGNRLHYGIDGEKITDGRVFELNPVAAAYKGDVAPALQVIYRGDDWMFIRSGESLLFKVDGEVLRFERTNYNDKVLDGGSVIEAAGYDVSLEQLQRIAAGEEVLVRAEGKNFAERVHRMPKD